MKNFIMGLGVFVVYMIIITLSFDSKILVLQQNELGYIAQELSATGTLFIEFENYSDGYIAFNDEEGIKAIDDQIKKLMELEDDREPKEGSYWQDRVDYKVHFYDDTGIRMYDYGAGENFEKVIHEDDPINIVNGGDGFYGTEVYSDAHEVDKVGASERINYEKTIKEPTVVVSIDAGRPRFRLPYFQARFEESSVIRTSSHIWRSYRRGGDIEVGP